MHDCVAVFIEVQYGEIELDDGVLSRNITRYEDEAEL
jgi:hypothetical protein